MGLFETIYRTIFNLLWSIFYPIYKVIKIIGTFIFDIIEVPFMLLVIVLAPLTLIITIPYHLLKIFFTKKK